jgi:tetratricopeptide (TPR) repeat protein
LAVEAGILRRVNALRAGLLLSSVAFLWTNDPAVAAEEVRLWETNQVIPTYAVAPPDPIPRFYTGRTYQGARATFYPYPVSDRLTDLRTNQTYRAVFLENRYAQISVLPELGGRIFSAVDKSNNYDFFYRQHVIKPALIGMLGAWISGGVEWNVPHHHRATSFSPVDYTLEEHADGSKTIWVGEIELRHRLKWIVGLTLYPDRSYVEMMVRVSNRTPVAQSFLFWINPAVHANENYQVIFPPSTEFAVQHGKPEFAHWPIARETYGGTDYSRGVDISWWKNHPSPVSFFCWNSPEDFFGGYDHGRQAGVVHYANHHFVPGKKFFEWGVGPEGQLWSEILTDTDGPYLELMAGAYSDNQPDYSWIQPGEVKSWKHYWYPVQRLGAFKNATLDAAVNLELTNRVIKLAFNTTAEFANATAKVTLAGKTLFERKLKIGPAQPFATDILLENEAAPEQLRAALVTAEGRELVAYQPVQRSGAPMPAPVKRPIAPKEIKTSEELYLTGLRIEQLYSPAFEAAPYYEEAIQRDPGDYRANTALGIQLCRAWRWSEAEARLRAAVERATANYIRPKDVEAAYYLGVALQAQGRSDAARDAFFRAAWSSAWQAPAYFALAELECARGRYAAALELATESLAAGVRNSRARNLCAALFRYTDRPDLGQAMAEQTLELDPLDFWARNELVLAHRHNGAAQDSKQALGRLNRLMRGEPQNYLELAADYANAGLWIDAMEVLRRAVNDPAQAARPHPMTRYCLGYYAEQAGRPEEAGPHYQAAARVAPDYCFPLRSEDEPVLRRATQANPKDARASFYLGNLLFDRQPAQAVAAWEKARQLDDSFALAHRNLALAYSQFQGDIPKAMASLEKAVALKPAEARFLYELDALYEAAGVPVARRLEMLDAHQQALEQRDDAFTRRIVVLLAAGQPDRAVELLRQRRFHNWEGRGEIHGLYADALLQQGLARLRARQPQQALEAFQAALEYPRNLEVGRPNRDRKAPQIHYFLGLAQEALGQQATAKESFAKVVARLESGASELQFHQGLALRKIGRGEEAKPIFQNLLAQGQKQLESRDTPDYFAKFGEKQAERIRRAQAHYLAGLGHLGLGQPGEAREQFQKALEQHPAHLGALRESAQ